MIKGIEHMYAIYQSKLRESKTFSLLHNLQKCFLIQRLGEDIG
jgi:hypothetical protein